MAIIKCPECGKEVSDKAELCPHCGIDLKNELRRKKYSGITEKALAKNIVEAISANQEDLVKELLDTIQENYPNGNYAKVAYERLKDQPPYSDNWKYVLSTVKRDFILLYDYLDFPFDELGIWDSYSKPMSELKGRGFYRINSDEDFIEIGAFGIRFRKPITVTCYKDALLNEEWAPHISENDKMEKIIILEKNLPEYKRLVKKYKDYIDQMPYKVEILGPNLKGVCFSACDLNIGDISTHDVPEFKMSLDEKKAILAFTSSTLQLGISPTPKKPMNSMTAAAIGNNIAGPTGAMLGYMYAEQAHDQYKQNQAAYRDKVDRMNSSKTVVDMVQRRKEQHDKLSPGRRVEYTVKTFAGPIHFIFDSFYEQTNTKNTDMLYKGQYYARSGLFGIRQNLATDELVFRPLQAFVFLLTNKMFPQNKLACTLCFGGRDCSTKEEFYRKLTDSVDYYLDRFDDNNEYSILDYRPIIEFLDNPNKLLDKYKLKIEKYALELKKEIPKVESVSSAEELISKFESISQTYDVNEPINELQEKKKQIIYNNICERFDQIKTIDQYKSMYKELETIKGYEDVDQMLAICEQKIKEFQDIEREYKEAQALYDTFEYDNFVLAKERFVKLNEHKDCTSEIARCEQRIRECEQKKKADKKQKVKKKIMLVLFILLLMGLICWGIIKYIEKQRVLASEYKLGQQYLEEQNYDEAYDVFVSLGKYSDSIDMSTKTLFEKACYLTENKEFSEAVSILNNINSYQPALEQVYKTKELWQQEVISLIVSGKYSEAEEEITQMDFEPDSDLDSLLRKHKLLSEVQTGKEAISLRDLYKTLDDIEKISNNSITVGELKGKFSFINEIIKLDNTEWCTDEVYYKEKFLGTTTEYRERFYFTILDGRCSMKIDSNSTNGSYTYSYFSHEDLMISGKKISLDSEYFPEIVYAGDHFEFPWIYVDYGYDKILIMNKK